MISIEGFLANYESVLQIVALVTIVLITLSSIDDLFIDAIYWTRRLKHRLFQRAHKAPVEALLTRPEQHLAIMLPAWQEHEVIAAMVDNAISTLTYENYTIFAGVYTNDPQTIAEADRLAKRYRRVRKVQLPHGGPTCKADCLNFIVAEIFAHEEREGIKFAGMILHDSEDVLHPLELKYFNYLLPYKDLIQLPVVSLEQGYRDLVAGIYMDEFAEWHAKDLVVREVLTRSVPSAGVGTCFSRAAMLLLMEEGQQPFNSATLTEDYDIATRLAARGQTSIIAQYPVEFRVRRHSLLGLGPPQILQFEMPLCVREHFPNTIRTSYRQKARWTLGIALQGWEQLGWSKSPVANYFLFRDRKAILTPTLAIIGYLLAINYITLNLVASAIGLPPVSLFGGDLVEVWLLIFNAFALAARVVQRIYFTRIIYGWGHALVSLPRIFLASIVNFLATMRALRIFIRSKFTKESIAWDKTAHRFPTREWLVQDKRELGDILVEWEAVTEIDRDDALIEQSITGESLGEILVRKGLDELLLAEAVASQSGLPFTEVPFDAAKAFHRRLPADVSVRLRAVPIGVGDKGQLRIALARPLSNEETARMVDRLGGKFDQLIAPESQLIATIQRLQGESADIQHALAVPSLSQMLLENRMVSRKAIKSAMRSYRPGLHGSFGEYLIARDIIGDDLIAKLAADQKSMIADQQKVNS